jgi:hypothetical protein
MAHRTIGNRTTWPHPNVFHWEIRKAYTISRYYEKWSMKTISSSDDPTQLHTFLKNYNDFKKNVPNLDLTFPMYLDLIYHRSCKDMLDSRFSFYETALPSSSYRRTSLDFRMVSSSVPKIGAFVEKAFPGLVKINQGTVYAIEDASHVLMAFWDNPLDLIFNFRMFESQDANITIQLPLIQQPLRAALGNATRRNDDLVESFHRYPASYLNHGIYDFSSVKRVPACIRESFLIISTDLDRQIFADNLSTMSLLWVIAHEDAHSYLGHLKYFEKMGLSEQDHIFNELISSIDDDFYVKIRRSAELEADTCAAMRSVDYCFDNEFLSIVTDWMSPEINNLIFENRTRSNELRASQRLFLLRLIILSCILPLIVFEISLESETMTNLKCYPSFSIRALNIILTVADRAVDIQSGQPLNLVGTMLPHELIDLFRNSLKDISAVYLILASKVDSSRFREFSKEEFEDLHEPLFIAFLVERGLVDKTTLTSEIVVDFILQRYSMHQNKVDTFFEAKKEVNYSRIQKVEEDLIFAKRKINHYRNAFSFIDN